VTVCPVDCIHPTKGENNFAEAVQLFINPVDCIDCGLCAEECPVSAIFAEDDLPSEWRDFIEKNVNYFHGK
jgi:NAD-dependent dihydropyrimidine dehydrogenase PreA subunit